MFHENSIWTEERDPVNTATQKKKKKSQFQPGKTGECSKSTGVRDDTKATGCGQRDGPSPHISQPCCVQKNSVCSLAHRTGCSSLFNPSFPSPWFSAAPLYQHCPNSPNPGLSICGTSEQLSRAGTLETLSLLSSGSLAPGHLSFSWRMENRHLVSPEVEGLLWHKLWNLGCFIFLPFFFFYSFLQKLFCLPANSYMCGSSQKLLFFPDSIKEQKCCPVISPALLKQTHLPPAGIPRGYTWPKVWWKLMSLRELGTSCEQK